MSLTSLVAEQHVVLEASEKDFDALNRLITHSTVIKNEQPEDRSFDDVIFKPWGNEARVYVDNFYDLWLLRISEGERTSLHSHARKLTQLLCLSGVGVVTSLNGEHPIGPGSVVRIAAGAFHSTRAVDGPLYLIEVETPRNKLDLVRLEDAYSRDATHYEVETGVPAASPLKRLPHLPGASIRRTSPDGAFDFAIRTGMDIFYTPDPRDLFYIPLGIRALLTRSIPVLRPQDLVQHRPATSETYISVRPSTH